MLQKVHNLSHLVDAFGSVNHQDFCNYRCELRFRTWNDIIWHSPSRVTFINSSANSEYFHDYVVCFLFCSGISVGLFHEFGADEIARVSLECKADIMIVENELLLKRVLLIQHKLPDLRAIVQLSGEPPLTDKRRLHKSHKVSSTSSHWVKILISGQKLDFHKRKSES